MGTEKISNLHIVTDIKHKSLELKQSISVKQTTTTTISSQDGTQTTYASCQRETQPERHHARKRPQNTEPKRREVRCGSAPSRSVLIRGVWLRCVPDNSKYQIRTLMMWWVLPW